MEIVLQQKWGHPALVNVLIFVFHQGSLVLFYERIVSTTSGKDVAIGESLSTSSRFLSPMSGFVSTIGASPKIGTSASSGCPKQFSFSSR